MTTSAPDPFLAPGRLSREAARARAADLYARHARTVEGLCRGLLRDRSDAEDAAQQTFLSAYRALLAGTEPREPGAWLAAIARNECLARIRSRMREPLPVHELETAEPGADPLGEAIRRADLAALWTAIGELPRQQRDALLLREFGGLSYGELALALGVSGPAVESLLFRARTRVRGQLKEALASVGWIGDALARLLSAGGAAKIGSVPVVAKVVTAGVGVAVVASTAVVTERHSGSPHRRPAPVHHAAAPVVAAPKPAAPAPQQPAAVVPVAAVRVVRHVRAARPVGQTAPAVAAASQGHQRDDSEAAVKLPVKAEKSHGRPAKRSHGSGHHHGKGGRREAAKIDEASSDHGGGSSRDEGGDAQQPGQSGDSGDSGHGSDSHGNVDSHGSGDAVATGVTRVTDLLPHGGRGLRAGD